MPFTIKELKAGLPHITATPFIQNKLTFTQAVGIRCWLLGGNYIELVDVSANFTFDGMYVGAAEESRQGVFTHLSCPKCKRKFRPMFWARAFYELFLAVLPLHFGCRLKRLKIETEILKVLHYKKRGGWT